VSRGDGELSQAERPELSQLLSLLHERASSTTAVVGLPGAGKSALMAALGHALLERGWPVLAIKADLLDTGVTTEADLQARLGLPEKPSVILERLAKLGPVVLLIDQLDALAGYLDVRTGRLSVLLNLVRRLGRMDNFHIVLSARAFEYEHDVRLRAISAESLNQARSRRQARCRPLGRRRSQNHQAPSGLSFYRPVLWAGIGLASGRSV
jgi:ATPase family associated with various cellular activities (AAA)